MRIKDEEDSDIGCKAYDAAELINEILDQALVEDKWNEREKITLRCENRNTINPSIIDSKRCRNRRRDIWYEKQSEE